MFFRVYHPLIFFMRLVYNILYIIATYFCTVPYIKIRHSNGLESFYGQLNEVLVKTGDKVYTGQEIGKVGSTGWSTGPHLHFGISKDGVPVNPELYIK